MSALPIVCDNCGAKYRLPESFSGDRAKCKQCGSVIDVAAQKTVADTPPAPVRVPARAARESARPAARPGREARAERSPRSRRNRGEAGRSQARAEERRRAREDSEAPAKKKNTMLFVGGGVGALAIIAVIAILGTGGDPPKGTEAATDGAAAGVAATKTVADAAARLWDAHATDAPAHGAAKASWQDNTTGKLADVFDPKTLGELQWPAEVGDAHKAEIRTLVASIAPGSGGAARPKIEQMGYYGVCGLVERLRQLDYTSSEQQRTAGEIHTLLAAMCPGMHTGFAAVEPGEALDPRKADFNARTAFAWGTLLTQCPTKASFDAWRSKRLVERK